MSRGTLPGGGGPGATVLLVDDDQALGETLSRLLTRRGYTTSIHASGEDALSALDAVNPDVVVTDINMARMDGLELCRRITETRPDVPVVMITAFGSLDTAIESIRAGAWDFITKPFDADTLTVVLDRAIRYRHLHQEVRRLRETSRGNVGLDGIIGESAPVSHLRDLIRRVAGTDVSVLVTGESGAGKELVARAIHRASDRASGPFVAVNCAAMPEALLESELFGHARGAFTDARTARTGLCFQASGGTLFLDEIGELPLGLQPKLLRAIQERSARPLGADKELPFDARLVVATNRDLELEVEEGRFRADLYYRINVVGLDVAPLRARGGDVLLLAQHFLQQYAERFRKRIGGFTAEAAERLLAYDWPGNVRELSNAMERAVALTRYEQITVDDLPDRLKSWRHTPVMAAIDGTGDLVTLDELEQRYIERVLTAVSGNKAAAARVLGIDRRTLYRKLGRQEPA